MGNMVFWQRLALLVVGVGMAALAHTVLAESSVASTINAAAVALITFAGGAIVGAGVFKRPGDAGGKAKLPISGSVVFLALLFSGCSPSQLQKVFDVSDTILDVARALCLSAGQQATGLSVADVHKKFCETREQLEPWIGLAQEARATGSAQVGMMPADADGE